MYHYPPTTPRCSRWAACILLVDRIPRRHNSSAAAATTTIHKRQESNDFIPSVGPEKVTPPSQYRIVRCRNCQSPVPVRLLFADSGTRGLGDSGIATALRREVIWSNRRAERGSRHEITPLASRCCWSRFSFVLLLLSVCRRQIFAQKLYDLRSRCACCW